MLSKLCNELNPNPSLKRKLETIENTSHEKMSAMDAIRLRYDKISTKIIENDSLRLRICFFIWFDYPPDFENHLKGPMGQSLQYLIQPEKDKGIPYLIGFFQFNNLVSYIRFKHINSNIICSSDLNSCIEWRKSKITTKNIIGHLFYSVTIDGPRKMKNLIINDPWYHCNLRIENQFADALKRFSLTIDFKHNSIIPNTMGSKKRPDFYGMINDYFIIIEIDQHQHAGYKQEKETQRLIEIFNVVQMKYSKEHIIVIRLNPNSFKGMNCDKRISVPFENQIIYLKMVLQELKEINNDNHLWKQQFTRNGIYILYLFYNGFAEETIISNLQFVFIPVDIPNDSTSIE